MIKKLNFVLILVIFAMVWFWLQIMAMSGDPCSQFSNVPEECRRG